MFEDGAIDWVALIDLQSALSVIGRSSISVSDNDKVPLIVHLADEIERSKLPSGTKSSAATSVSSQHIKLMNDDQRLLISFLSIFQGERWDPQDIDVLC